MDAAFHNYIHRAVEVHKKTSTTDAAVANNAVVTKSEDKAEEVENHNYSDIFICHGESFCLLSVYVCIFCGH